MRQSNLFTVSITRTYGSGYPEHQYESVTGTAINSSPKLAYREADANCDFQKFWSLVEEKIEVKHGQEVVKFQPW